MISSPRQAGASPEIGERLLDLVEEVGLEELLVREVDAQLEAAVLGMLDLHLADLPAPLQQHEAADGHDQPGLLGHREELLRQQQAAPRVVPAQQGLEARHLAAREVDERLVVDPELAALDRPAQVGLELQARHRRSGACRG